MRNLLIGAALALLLVLLYRACEHRNDEQERLEESSSLIQEQVRKVGKLVVTEGSFSQVYTFENSKTLYFDLLSARKKALIVVNTDVDIAYDLSKMQVEVDKENQRVVIRSIPKPEVKIHPDIQYYDITQDYLNKFDAEDHNTIRKRITADLRKKVAKSAMMSNAENRLISELAKIYILTSTMGWTLEYNNEQIEAAEELEALKL